MAFNLSTIESLTINGQEFKPNLDKEKRMRLAELKIDQYDFSDAIEVIANCFENGKEDLKVLLQKVTYMDLLKIRTFLTDGMSGVEALENRVDRAMDKKMDELMAKQAEDDDNE